MKPLQRKNKSQMIREHLQRKQHPNRQYLHRGYCPKKETPKVARRFIVDIKYPVCDSLEKAEEYLQEMIESDLVGEDKGRWCVNVREIK